MRIIGNRGNTARKVQAVASGVLASGDTVIVNANGTVSAAASSGSEFSKGSPVVFDTQDPTEGLSVVYDSSNNKVVVIYSDSGNSSYGTAVVGTVSGTSISFGTPVVFNSGNTQQVGATFDSNSNKVIPVWHQAIGTTLRAIVGTVSGTGISFGSSTTFSNDGTGAPVVATFDSSSNKVVVAYLDTDNSSDGIAIVGTVSGTSISFGSATVWQAAASSCGLTFDSNSNKVVIGYGKSSVGYGIVGTVSGTSISFGTRVALDGSNNAERLFLTFDSANNKVVFGYTARSDSESGAAIVGTVSGTSISFGSPSFFIGPGEGNYQIHGATYDSTADRVVFSSVFESGSKIFISSASISGTSLVFGDNDDTGQTTFQFSPIVYDSNTNTVVCVYQDAVNSKRGTALVTTTNSFSTNLTAENFIGIASNGYATGQAATINAKGFIDDNQSSLTAGQSYFVQSNGDLGLTAGSPSVFAGTAVSATKLIVKG